MGRTLSRIYNWSPSFGKGEIGRQDDRGALVKSADQVEQHLAAADRERQVSQLVEDDEIDADELVGQFAGLTGARLGLELVDQIDRGEEAHAGAVAHAIGADRYGDMALADAGRNSAILPGFRP
jgi:hypothetical protein